MLPLPVGARRLPLSSVRHRVRWSGTPQFALNAGGTSRIMTSTRAQPCVERPCAHCPVSSPIERAMRSAPGSHGESRSLEKGLQAGVRPSVMLWQ